MSLGLYKPIIFHSSSSHQPSPSRVNISDCRIKRALATESKEKMVETRGQAAQRRKRVAWNTVESEQGVFMDILSRLPVKSMHSLRTINRYWHGSVRNRFFAKMQLSRSRENPAFIACQVWDSKMKLYSMKPGSFQLSYMNMINPPERSDERQMHVVSSFKGLLCCINQICDDDVENQLWDLQIWICNPCTVENVLLPQGRPSFEFVPIVGVAYGSDIGDYKLFRIFCVGKKQPEERVYGRIYIEDRQIVRTYTYAVVTHRRI